MQSTVYRLGMWNPAGARHKDFKTAEERDRYREHATRTGYVCWDGGVHVHSR